MERERHYIIYLFFSLVLACNIGLWFHSSHMKARWGNVPPVPGKDGTLAFALGDQQFAYRATGMMLQNLGSTAENYEPLKNYDYDMIGQWLFLADRLDPRSDFVPLLAAYYFGATQNSKQLSPVIDYLATVGERPEVEGGQRWRWLAQAVFLARFRVGDMNKALELAQLLAQKWRPGLPLWVKQAPAFVMTATGDKKTAYALMLTILDEEKGKVPQAELNNTMVFICQRILDKQEAAQSPLCTSLPANVK